MVVRDEPAPEHEALFDLGIARRAVLRGIFAGLLFAAVPFAVWLFGTPDFRSVRGNFLDLLALSVRGRWFGNYLPAENCDPYASIGVFFFLGLIAAPLGLLECVVKRSAPTRGRDIGAIILAFTAAPCLAHLVLLSRWSPIADARWYVRDGIAFISPSIARALSPGHPIGSLFTDQIALVRTLELFSIYALPTLALPCSVLAGVRRWSLGRAVMLGAIVSPIPAIVASCFASSALARHAVVAAVLGAGVPLVLGIADHIDGRISRRFLRACGE